MEYLRGELSTLRLVLGLIRENSNQEKEMLDELSGKVREIASGINSRYKYVSYDKSGDDPSIKYFGIDWTQTFDKLEGFIECLSDTEPSKSDLSSIVAFINRIEGEVYNHIIAVRYLS